MQSNQVHAPPEIRRGIFFAASVIGVGLSGFLDGILLHQVLQWHHLLSLVPGETFHDIHVQILADGLFHVLMYVITGLGLWLLWRRRVEFSQPAVGWRTVVGGGLSGFGIWNIIDVAFFHWILMIHRIRVGVPDPLAYDLAWLVLFGLLPTAAAWFLSRRGPNDNRTGGGRTAATLSLIAIVAAPIATRPQPGLNTAVVLFGPSTEPATLINAAVSADTPIIWMDPQWRLMVVSLPSANVMSGLYRAGAMIVTRSPAVAGCLAATAAS